MSDSYDWNALAKQAEAGRLAPVKNTTLRGDDAARAGIEALLAATGVDSIDEAKRVALGRPRLAAEGEASVTWKVRASTKLDSIVDEMALREGRTRSALIRDAVAEYARTHHSA
jgi:hypothetical protein